jgi:hypothetical protein
MSRALLVALAALLPFPLLAQQAAPPCSAPEYRQFDFWVGEWTVTDSAGGVVYGANTITQEENGCLVHERWRGSRGGTGRSFNFFEPGPDTWTQVWVSSTANVLRLAGRFDGRSMVLEGESALPGGGRARNRITWTPQPDGRVRQAWAVSRDGGATWQTSFDGWYRRVS